MAIVFSFMPAKMCSNRERLFNTVSPNSKEGSMSRICSDRNSGLKRKTYRFQTEHGGHLKVSVGKEKPTQIEISDMSPGFKDNCLALRWKILGSSGSDSSKDSCEVVLDQTSPGHHTSELEIDYPDAPAYLSFNIYSPSSADVFIGKRSFKVPVGFARGKPEPLGVTFFDDGIINFSLFPSNSKRVVLCLFEDFHSKKPSLELELDPYVNKTGDVWHVSLENGSKYARYGFKYDDSDDVCLDPYARIVSSLSPSNGELKQVKPFDWSGDIRLSIPIEKLVIYRLNVGEFTCDETSGLSEDMAGTFGGVMEKIPHLKSLGVNAVLLEPIFFFEEDQGPYFSHSFFALKDKYGPPGDDESAMNSMKEMVKQMHANSIEVLLEVDFSRTKDAQKMIIDSLRRMVIDFHVDGFCLVNAAHFVGDADRGEVRRSSLIESIAFNPVLANSRLIADSWSPLDTSYCEMNFPHWKKWSEINARFCKDVRNFVRGQGLLGDLASRICGSGDIFSAGPTHSLNFITRNSGLSLVDLVSFELSTELSWNCGEEGPTSNPVVLETRLKQTRNFLFILFVSLGVPVLNMGDECGMSAGGSVSYHDRSSFDWDYLETSYGRQMTRFISFLGSLRNRRSDLFQRRAFHGADSLQWHGADLSEPRWEDPSARFLALTLKAEKGDVFIVFNADDVPSTAVLPEVSKGYKWARLVDTSCSFPGFFFEVDDPDSSSYSGMESYELKAHTCCLFEARMDN